MTIKRFGEQQHEIPHHFGPACSEKPAVNFQLFILRSVNVSFARALFPVGTSLRLSLTVRGLVAAWSV